MVSSHLESSHILSFDLSVLVVQRLFNGCSTVVQRLFGVAAGRNGFLILMCQLKNYRPWHIIPHATYRFSSQ